MRQTGRTEPRIDELSAALVTGASSGLGAAFVEELARRGIPRLIVTARRRERLETLAERVERSGRTRVTVITADLTVPEGRDLVSEAAAAAEPLDLLINNAGFGSVTPFAESDRDREVRMVELNAIAPLVLLRSIVPAMIARRRGFVVNVSSTAAFQPLPFMATYGASKSFLLELSLALAAELRGSGVRVLTHCPGPTLTEFHLAAGLEEKLSHLPAMPAEIVAGRAIDALLRGDMLHIPGVRNRLIAAAARALPPALAARTVAWKLRHDARRS